MTFVGDGAAEAVIDPERYDGPPHGGLRNTTSIFLEEDDALDR